MYSSFCNLPTTISLDTLMRFEKRIIAPSEKFYTFKKDSYSPKVNARKVSRLRFNLASHLITMHGGCLRKSKYFNLLGKKHFHLPNKKRNSKIAIPLSLLFYLFALVF